MNVFSENLKNSIGGEPSIEVSTPALYGGKRRRIYRKKTQKKGKKHYKKSHKKRGKSHKKRGKSRRRR